MFLCNAGPRELDPAVAARIDERIILLEGTLGLLPWSPDGDPRPGAVATNRRAEVIRELIRFHQLDAIHAQGDRADELLAAISLVGRY